MVEGEPTARRLFRGELLGDYRIESVAGEGGMGIVYRATQRSLGRAVALKVIRSEIAQAPEYHDRFLREARLAASVDHPNVVPVYDVGEDDGHLWLAMQWIDGKDLRSLIATYGPRLPDRAIAITAQIASALDAVHSAGLVHRDVKPANVLIRDVDAKDHAYLTDFGVAKPPEHGADQLTRTGSVVGTTGYLSPEQIRGSEPGPRSDLYALGCVFFETLTGRPPFPGDNELAIRWAHANDPRPPISDARPDLGTRYDAFIARALAVDPQQRFKSGRELADALTATHTGHAAEAKPIVVPHVPTAVGPPTPLPPAATPLPQTGAYPVYVTPPPGAYSPPARGGSPLALILLGLVAIAGIAVGALAAAGGFAGRGTSGQTQTITSTRAAHTAPLAKSVAVKRRAPRKPATAAATGSVATTSCGRGVSVGPDTSCPFGRDVARAYQGAGAGTTDVTAYSPVTNQTYVMHCTAGTPVVCTGGHNAAVYIASSPSPSSASQSSSSVASQSSSSVAGTAITACDPNISVNAVTSCPFAENVFQAYANNYQANGEQSEVTVSASSPATGKTYEMDCGSDGATVDCTGGDNAFVTFSMKSVEVY